MQIKIKILMNFQIDGDLRHGGHSSHVALHGQCGWNSGDFIQIHLQENVQVSLWTWRRENVPRDRGRSSS